jgi:hypothetical protein
MSRLGRARRYYGCSGYDCTLNDEKSKQIRGPSVTVPCGCFSAELGPPLRPGFICRQGRCSCECRDQRDCWNNRVRYVKVSLSARKTVALRDFLLQCPSGPQPRRSRLDRTRLVRLIHVNLKWL